jgi:flagellar biosynthesis/type III secretory pathway protein FliH
MCRTVLAGLLVLCTTFLAAQERHLGTESAKLLYMRSAFAHGYMHVYEEGFHHGDLDLQLVRSARDPASISAYKKPCSSYHSNFGSKEMFKSGFEDGFRAGYSDAIHGMSFHAVERLRTAANGLNESSDKKATAHFDDGFRDGYRNGRRHGTDDGRNFSDANPLESPCFARPRAYCDAYSRAFQIGYADGYDNQTAGHPPHKLEASAQSKKGE